MGQHLLLVTVEEYKKMGFRLVDQAPFTVWMQKGRKLIRIENVTLTEIAVYDEDRDTPYRANPIPSQIRQAV